MSDYVRKQTQLTGDNRLYLDIVAVGRGSVVWGEMNDLTGEVSVKFFNGTETVDIATYPTDYYYPGATVNLSIPDTFIVGQCVFYRSPSNAEWTIYDPLLTSSSIPPEGVISDGEVKIEGNRAVWLRSIYAKSGDVDPEKRQLVMYTCGTGEEILYTFDNEWIWQEGEFWMDNGVVVWVDRKRPTYPDLVSAEIWVHDASGTRLEWEVKDPYDGNDVLVYDWRMADWRNPDRVNTIFTSNFKNKLIALPAVNTWRKPGEEKKQGVFIHQIDSGWDKMFFPGSGSYGRIQVSYQEEQGKYYVSWLHYADTEPLPGGEVIDIQVYDVKANDTKLVEVSEGKLYGYILGNGWVLYWVCKYGDSCDSYSPVDLYLYNRASDGKKKLATGLKEYDEQQMAFRDGVLAIVFIFENNVILRYYKQGPLGPFMEANLGRSDQMRMGALYLDDNGRPWWTAEYPINKDYKDWDLFTMDVDSGKVVQVTPAERFNHAGVGPNTGSGLRLGPGGTIAWEGLNNLTQREMEDIKGFDYQIFLGGSAVPYISGDVKFKDGDGKEHTLPDLEMEFLWGTNNNIPDPPKKITIYTDASGHFEVSPPVTGNVQGKARFKIKLKDKQGWIEVKHPDPGTSGNPPTLVTFETTPFNFSPPTVVDMNINLTNTGAFKNPSIGTSNQARLDDLAQIYYFTHQAALFAQGRLKLTLVPPCPKRCMPSAIPAGCIIPLVHLISST